MHNLNVKVFVEREDCVKFTGDDGKQVHIERMVAYLTFPNARFPLKMFINKVMPVGDYAANVLLDVKKDKLSVRLDLDSMVLEKLSTPSPLAGKA